jgi:hypothetical protein
MAQKITINNFNASNRGEISELTATATAASSTATLANTQGFSADDVVVLGSLGTDDSDAMTVLTVDSATQLTFTAPLPHSHAQFMPVTQLFGDKIKVYRAANVDGSQPADADFSSIATVSLDLDQAETSYTDDSGGSGYWYKVTQFNSFSNTETSKADSPAVRGGNEHTYCTIEAIRKEAGIQKNRNISDWDISVQRQYVQSLIDAELVGLYSVPFTAPVSPVIAGITWQWTAGLLLLQSYGAMTVLNSNNGQAKIDKANATLDKLKDRTLLLTDSSGTTTVLSTSGGGLEMWPNTTTAEAEATSGGGARMFRVSDRY